MAGKQKYQKGPRPKSQLEILEERDRANLKPLKLTPKDADFLNRMNKAADEAEARAREGGNGTVYYPVAACIKLQRLGGRSEEYLSVWKQQRAELVMRYPTTPNAVYLELKRIRRRIDLHKKQIEEQKNAQ